MSAFFLNGLHNFGVRNMNKKMGFVALAIVASLSLQGAAWAETAVNENTLPPLQIVNKTGIKVVIQVNDAGVIPMNGVSKQVMGAKMLHDQYASLGMKSGKDYEIVMVFRAAGSQFLLNDDAYDEKAKGQHPKGNPNKAMIEAMQKDGVKMYECAVAMKMQGYENTDLLPFARVVASGMGAIVDLEKSGYLEVTP
jgi:intracellular sulfur oxidation DsrE/DsrF family protein